MFTTHQTVRCWICRMWAPSRHLGNLTVANWVSFDFKGGPEPSNFEDLCLVNVSVKYFNNLCFGTIKIQPELKYLETILEVFTS